MDDIRRRVFGPEHCLTRLADLKALGMALFELAPIDLGNIPQRDTERVGGDGKAPEHIAQLLDESLGAGVALLKDLLPNEAKDFTRFFRKAGGGVEQSLVRRKRRICRAEGGALEFLEGHGIRG